MLELAGHIGETEAMACSYHQNKVRFPRFVQSTSPSTLTAVYYVIQLHQVCASPATAVKNDLDPNRLL